MCLLGVLIYFTATYFDFMTPAASRYEELFEQRKSLAHDLNELNNQYNSENLKLNQISDLNERGLSLQNLKSINGEILGTLAQMIRIDTDMKELSLEGDAYIQTIDVYESDLIKFNLNKLHSEIIDHQIKLNEYYIGEERSNECLNSIDYNKGNNEISDAIYLCIEKIESQINLFNQISADLPVTKEYLDVLNAFWLKNAQLYIAIEARDSNSATSLESEIKSLSSEKELQYEESKNEITAWIQSLESEIAQF